MLFKKLSENGLTVSRPIDSPIVFDMIFVDYEITKGKHYWEITVDEIDYIENILIGVAKKTVSMTVNPFDTGAFWGIQPLA